MSRQADAHEAQVMRLGRTGLTARTVEIVVDGEPVECFEGETVATALLARHRFVSTGPRRPHALWCAIGVCFECVVEVAGVPGVRACLTPVRSGLQVGTGIDPTTAAAADD